LEFNNEAEEYNNTNLRSSSLNGQRFIHERRFHLLQNVSTSRVHNSSLCGRQRLVQGGESMVPEQGRLVVLFERKNSSACRLLTFEDLYVLIVTTQISAINDITCGGYERKNDSKIGHRHTLDPKTTIKSPIHENAALCLSIRPISNLAQGSCAHFYNIPVHRPEIAHQPQKCLQGIEHGPRLSTRV